MDSAPAFISSMTNGAAQQDGSAIAFEIQTCTHYTNSIRSERHF